MTPKIALVTGGNKGIGLEICRQLGRLNHTILVGARNPQRGNEAVSQLQSEAIDAVFVQIDMNDATTFATAATFIEDTYGRLDVLINNAAIGIDNGRYLDSLPMSVLRETFEVNFFSHVELTQQLLPLIKKSAEGRIVNHSSILGSLAVHDMPEHAWIKNLPLFAYNASKTAINSFTVHLAEYLADTSIKVNAAHPGSVKTDMNPNGDLDLETGAKTAVTLATLPVAGPTGAFFHLGQTLPW